ncbi:MAG: methyl-accepting chemotaxis protein [Bdellovibrionales bacterium]|nr:methyl-accepting chemotaxis protein [Bdellovibrionales bacterium]
MFKNKSLNFKLRASFGALILLLLFVGGINIYFLNKTTSQYNHVTKVNLQNAIILNHLDSSSREVLRRFLQYTIKGNEAKDFERIDKNIKENLERYREFAAKYEAVPFVEGEAEIYAEVKKNWDAMQPFFVTMPAFAKSAKEEDLVKFGAIYRSDLKASRDSFFAALDKLIEFQINESVKWSTMAEKTSNMADSITMITVGLGVIFGTFIAYFISSGLTKQLTELTKSLSEGADVVAKASDSIAHSSEELSSSVNEQAAAIQETTASTEELSAMVKKNQENASESNIVSKKSAESAQMGKQSVEDMISAIGDIHTSNQKMMTTVDNNNANIEEIIKVIHEISSKTKVINEIVFQTKLLSFNASVEAARAGEQGKGFAVVAEEVGNLAQMSGNAAQEISDMLSASTAKVESIVNRTKSEVGILMVEGKEKVEHGISVAQKCNTVLDQIVEHVGSVDGMVADITIASEEQSKGIAEISRAMGQLDQATQINADSSRQMAFSSEELSGQARKLNDLVTDLKSTIEGFSG